MVHLSFWIGRIPWLQDGSMTYNIPKSRTSFVCPKMLCVLEFMNESEMIINMLTLKQERTKRFYTMLNKNKSKMYILKRPQLTIWMV